jgi:hypothetical protein
MLRSLPLGLLLGLLFVGGTLFGAEEEPRTLIERAIKAQGGEELLRSQNAVLMKLKGKVTDAAPGITIELTCESYHQADGKERMSIQFNAGGAPFEASHVFTGEEAWMKINGVTEKLSDVDVKAFKASAHQERVTMLWPLLRDKSFSFQTLPERKIHDRPALGIKVLAKDRPDVDLYFDKQTGLLCSYRYKAPEIKGDGKEIEHETTLSDYRELDYARQAEERLKKAELPTGNKEIVEYLRRKTPTPELLQKVRQRIRDLGDDMFEVREKAGEELIALGPVALPALEAAVKDADQEVVRRAQDCLKAIEERYQPELMAAAIRLLALRQGPGATETLMALLPSSTGVVTSEIRAGLMVLAQRKDEALVKALDDKDPRKRTVARMALGKDSSIWLRQPLFPTGLKIAHKQIAPRPRGMVIELEIIDFQVFNQFEEKLFARPE